MIFACFHHSFIIIIWPVNPCVVTDAALSLAIPSPMAPYEPDRGSQMRDIYEFSVNISHFSM